LLEVRIVPPCLFATLLLFSAAARAAAPSDPQALEAYLFRSEDAQEARARVEPQLKKDLQKLGLHYGAPIHVRIFKEERQLELWVQQDARFKKFRSYDMCKMSGELGPKLEQGDDQAPEGFYSVDANWMWPHSSYHLAFNIRYPNDYDKALNRTGSAIMVHGGCSSSGCFAMTDEKIEEIYTLAAMAIVNGQSEFAVHVFPFRMTEANMKRHKGARWNKFWANLKEGYDLFESSNVPPTVMVADKRYVFEDTTRIAQVCDASPFVCVAAPN
jgi:murein L,D-transpeptidase YafK